MKLYTYVVGGVEHTAQMTEDYAERLGATPVAARPAPAKKRAPKRPAAKQAPAPENKAAGS